MSYHNLQEIQAAMHSDFFELIDVVVQVMLKHTSPSYLQLLAAMRERVKINFGFKKIKNKKEEEKHGNSPRVLSYKNQSFLFLVTKSNFHMLFPPGISNFMFPLKKHWYNKPRKQDQLINECNC